MKAPLSLLLLVACGASSAELKTAREANYEAEPAKLFQEVKAVTEHNYKIAGTDENTFTLRTAPRWYTPEGQGDASQGDNPSRLQDKSINLALVVALVKADSTSWQVKIEPIVLRKNELSSAPEQLQMSDPTVPGWVRGKIDSLQLEIHQRLKGYAVVEIKPASDRGGASPLPPGGW
jgi:hypothetical protein